MRFVWVHPREATKINAILAHQPASNYKVPELLESLNNLYGPTAGQYLLNTNGASTQQQKPIAFLQHNLTKITYATQIVTTAGPNVYYLYGSSRLGEQKHFAGTSNVSTYHQQHGSLTYEFTDHLGNVKLTTNNRLKLHYRNTAYHLEPTLLSSVDYYAFGMVMPGRSFSSGEYRYGFQGQERDDEIRGAGNTYTTEFRQYNPRIGRWWSVDKLANKFPHYSPYQYAGNRPIVAVDLDGLEDIWIHYTEQEDGSMLETLTIFELNEEQNNDFSKFMNLDLPPTGAVTTVKRLDGTYEIVNASPTYSVVEEKPESKPIEKPSMFSSVGAFENGIRGNTYGELEGEEGLVKFSGAIDNIGTGLLLTPAAPVGTGLKIFSAAVNSSLDLKNKTTTEAIINTGIRAVSIGLGEGAKKIVPPSITEQGKKLIDAGVNVVLDQAQEKLIENIHIFPKSELKNNKDD